MTGSPPTSPSRRSLLAALAATLALAAAAPVSAQALDPWRRRAWRRWLARERYRRWLEAQEGPLEPLFEEGDRQGEAEDDAAAAAFDRRVAEAERRGEIRPLREVEALVRRFNAELLEVELIETRRGWVYALRVLTARGRRRDIFLDAASLRRVGR